MAPPTAWKDSADDFGAVSITLHWLVAALVLALAALGLLMQWTIGFEDESLYLRLKHAHIGVGVLLCMALLPRIAWRLASGAPAAHPRPRAVRVAAKVIPALLLPAVTFQAATGVLGRWTDTRWVRDTDAQWRIVPGAEPLSFFGPFELESPFDAPHRQWNRRLERLHDGGAHAVMALLAVHVLGAAGHLMLAGGSSRVRMLRSPRQPTDTDG